MKLKYLIILVIIGFTNYSYCLKANSKNSNEFFHNIVKLNRNDNTLKTDTLRVFQNDTTVFKKMTLMITRPCSKPESAIKYELIHPINGAYYFIYNEKKQLVSEGKYTKQYISKCSKIKQGNFYTSKSYYYKKNGALDYIHYMKDGRNLKTEYFDSKKRFSKIRYLDKKSSNLKKIEFYKKGILKKTRIYNRYSNYYTVKA